MQTLPFCRTGTMDYPNMLDRDPVESAPCVTYICAGTECHRLLHNHHDEAGSNRIGEFVYTPTGCQLVIASSSRQLHNGIAACRKRRPFSCPLTSLHTSTYRVFTWPFEQFLRCLELQGLDRDYTPKPIAINVGTHGTSGTTKKVPLV